MILKPQLQNMINYFKLKEKRPHGKLLTLSRYQLGFDKDAFNEICKSNDWDAYIGSDDPRNELLNEETVFQALGFESFDSMDYSNYEFANIIHDLNKIVPNELVNNYDYIIEGGTIEHIFHIPNVLENVFKLLKTDGVFFFNLMAFWGINHGYYNFSPCLFYEYFKVNNYEINSFYLCFHDPQTNLILVADSDINSICRTMFPHSNQRVGIYGSVTKTAETTYDIIPYQGEYVREWESNHRKVIYDAFNNHDNLYLYGTGKTVRHILSTLPNRFRDKVLGLISIDIYEIGSTLYGYKIVSLDEAAVTGGGGYSHFDCHYPEMARNCI